jgi:hypothetical protein
LREFHHVFPEDSIPIDDSATTCEFLAIPSNQHAKEDLVGIGETIEQEKDRLLNVFMTFARVFCQKVVDAGHWAGMWCYIVVALGF